MKTGQKKFVRKVLRIASVAALAAIAAVFTYQHFGEEISAHRDALKWGGLVLFLIVSTLARAEGKIPNYEERHGALNRVFDENPWAKIYLVIYVIALAIGIYYAMSHHIDLVEAVGFFGLLGAVLMLMLPAFVIRLKEAYEEAGGEE